MGELRAKHSREEEERELGRLGCGPRNGNLFGGPEAPGNDLLVSLATLTIWKVRDARQSRWLMRYSWIFHPFQTMGEKAEQDDSEHLSAMLSRLMEEECRLLLDAWNDLLEEAEGARVERDVDDLARRIAWE